MSVSKKTKTTKPSRASTTRHQGIYVQPTRIGSVLNEDGLNYTVNSTRAKVREFAGHGDIYDENNVLVTPAVEPRSLLELPEKDLAVVNEARRYCQELRSKKTKLALEKEDAERAKAEELAKSKPDYREKTEYDRVLEQLNKLKIRFNKDAYDRVAVMLDTAMHELLNFGMSNVLRSKKSTLNTRHLLEKEYTTLVYSPLYSEIHTFTKALKADRLRRDEEQRKLKEKKKGGSSSSCTGLTEAPSVKSEGGVSFEPNMTLVKVVKKVVVSHKENGKRVQNFKHCIKEICNNIINIEVEDKKNMAYKKIIISAEVKEFCSNLMVEFIHRFGQVVRVELGIDNKKTLSAKIVKKLTTQFLIIGGRNYAKCNATFDRKLELFDSFRKKRQGERKLAKFLKGQDGDAESKESHSEGEGEGDVEPAEDVEDVEDDQEE